ncbi:MAG TPA: DnaT-like ssDNA-binding protein [Planctomycetota bacterium]|jgi:hypothetical protein
MADPYESILKDTESGADSNSYISLSEAKTLAAQMGLASWTGKTDQQIDQALLRACIEIEAHRFHNAVKDVAAQALTFPRKVDYATPDVVRLAQVYQADWLMVNGEADRKQWEGAKASPMDAGVGSPLCPRAFTVLAKLISRVGSFKD